MWHNMKRKKAMSMRIESIKLKNFRCFEDLEIAFHPQLTVIVGKNASGKSTILDAIAVAVGTFPSAFDGIGNYGIRKEDARLVTNKFGDSFNTSSVYPVSISANGLLENKEVRWERTLTKSTGRCTLALAKQITEITNAYQNGIIEGDTSIILPLVAYYGTGRLWLQHREKKEDVLLNSARTNGYIDCMDSAANDKLIMNWFNKETSKKLQKKTGTAAFDAVIMAIEKCVSLLMDDDDVSVSYNFDNNDLDIQYKKDENEVIFPLNRMSDGYKCTISLITDIAYRMAQLNPQLREKVLDAPGVVIIDEIDLHLHPEWQKRILGDLTSIFPNIQFIVSTHASSVISSVRSENLIVLEDNKAEPPKGEVYGKDSNTIHSGVMRSTERPDPVKNLFSSFYDALKNADIEKAKSVITEIEKLIGTNDPELAACHTKLTLAELKAGRRND